MVNINDEVIRKSKKWNVKYAIKEFKIGKLYFVLRNK